MFKDLIDLFKKWNDFIDVYKRQYDVTVATYNNFNANRSEQALLNQTSNRTNKVYLTPAEKNKLVNIDYIIKQALAKIPENVIGFKKNDVWPNYITHPVYNGYDAWIFLKAISFIYNGKTFNFLIFDSALFKESILIRPEVFFNKFVTSNILEPNLKIMNNRDIEKQQRKDQTIKQSQEQNASQLDFKDRSSKELMRRLTENYTDREFREWFANGPVYSEYLVRRGVPRDKIRRYESDFNAYRKLILNNRDGLEEWSNEQWNEPLIKPNSVTNFLNNNSQRGYRKEFNRYGKQGQKNNWNIDNEEIAKALIWEEKIIDLKNPFKFEFAYIENKDPRFLSSLLVKNGLYCVAFDYRAIKILSNDSDSIKKLLLEPDEFLTKSQKRERGQMFNLFASDIASFMDCEYFFANIAGASLVNSVEYEKLFYERTQYQLIKDPDINRNIYISSQEKENASQNWSNAFDKGLEEERIKQQNYIREVKKAKQQKEDGLNNAFANTFAMNNKKDNAKNTILNKKSTTAELLATWNANNESNFISGDEEKGMDELLKEIKGED